MYAPLYMIRQTIAAVTALIFVTSNPSSWSSTGIPKKNRNSCSRMGMLLVNDIYKSVIRLSTGTFLILILATGTLSRKPKTADTTTTTRVIGMTLKNSGRLLILYASLTIPSPLLAEFRLLLVLEDILIIKLVLTI